MGENSKIVTEHYPEDKLPDEPRRGLEGQMVRVTVEAEAATCQNQLPRTFRSFLGSAPGLYNSPEEVVAFIRGLRDESDR